MKSFRQRPVGWRNESYRHYLAQKGIRTRYYADTALGGFLRGYIEETGAAKEVQRKKAVSEGIVPLRLREEKAAEVTRGALSEEERAKVQKRLTELGKRRIAAPPWLELDTSTWQSLLSSAKADAISEYGRYEDHVENLKTLVIKAKNDYSRAQQTVAQAGATLEETDQGKILKDNVDATKKAYDESANILDSLKARSDEISVAQAKFNEYAATGTPSFDTSSRNRMNEILMKYRGGSGYMRPIVLVSGKEGEEGELQQ